MPGRVKNLENLRKEERRSMTVNNVNTLLAYAGRADAAGSVADESADGSF